MPEMRSRSLPKMPIAFKFNRKKRKKNSAKFKRRGSISSFDDIIQGNDSD